jgi:hypothetical protein
MRLVPLLIVEITNPAGQTFNFSYAETFVSLSKTPDGGVTGAEMDIPLAVIDAVTTAREEDAAAVLLEDAQWSWLNERIKNNRWGFASRVFQELIAAVEGAEKVDPNKKKDRLRPVPDSAAE